ncbi:MAG: hypothetical protein GX096_10340 [Clostridiales bacterium]|nr:hypothetical protein [Clostridiales bacterium]
MKTDTKKLQELFDAKELVVVNVGVSAFGEAIQKQGAQVIQVDWKPMAGGDDEMLKLLEMMGM